MKRKLLIVLSAVVALFVASVIAITSGLSDGQDVELNGLDLRGISDGSYVGVHEHGRWTNTLTVHVENEKITGIYIDKDVFASGITDCSGEVFRRVIEAQNTQIDAVSGATVTSKAYLKAIENALEKQ